MHTLEALGWNAHFATHFAPLAPQGLRAGRVAIEHQHLYRLLSPDGEPLASVSGRLRHAATHRDDFPAVGDWVAYAPAADRAVIHAVLPRQSKFSRQAAGGGTHEQIVAANVSTVLLVAALNRDFNLRRLERYLTLAWSSGASPVIVLNKADLCEAVAEAVAQVEAIALGAPVVPVSAQTGAGFEALEDWIRPGLTVALLGSSGVGKSSIINRLAGSARMHVGAAREDDDRGRHTTTHRELVLLDSGALLLDTPGMREIQLWEAEDGISTAFADIEAAAAACRFGDCRHDGEPGCAVAEGLEAGTIDPARFASWRKLGREAAFQARKTDLRARLEEKARWKQIHQAHKQRPPR